MAKSREKQSREHATETGALRKSTLRRFLSMRRFLNAMSGVRKWNFVKCPYLSRMGVSVQFAIRECPVVKRTYLSAISCTLTVVLLAHLGPFGTWAYLSASERLAFWASTVGANWIAGYIAFNIVARKFRALEWPIWPGFALAAVLAALPGTVAVWLLTAAYFDFRPASVREVAVLYFQVAVLHLFIGTFVFRLIDGALRRPAAAAVEATPHPVASGEPRLFARLPEAFRTELLHLCMQDHYVEVTTTTGRGLVLLRFCDALREVEGADGRQVHRSHWVARKALAGVERGPRGRIVLRLVNGTRVPVSRKHVGELRSLGWF